MFKLRHMRIGKRLAFAFGSLLLVLLLIGVFGIVQKQKINYFAQELGHRWLPGVRTAGEINDAFNQSRRTSLRYVLDESVGRPALLATREDLVDKTIPALFKKYEALMPSIEARRRLDDVKRRWAIYLVADEQLLALSDRGEAYFPQARALAAGATASDYVALVQALALLADWGNEQGRVMSVAADRQYTQGLVMSCAAIACALALSMLLARTITNSIIRPLRQGVAIAEAVASGDLTLQIAVTEKDEVAELLRAMQKMSDDLSVLVGSVRTCSASIEMGSDAIASGNADLSRRTEEQASNLEETAASMAQFTHAAHSNAEAAVQVRALAGAASHAAAQGGLVVDELVQTMGRIQDASRRIGDITGLIDGIAFQTNILALNAAVEAARAGERGRGFAVVAAEVRNLAQRAAGAAKEIKLLIDESIATIGAGTGQASLAGRNMNAIVSQVQRVSQLICAMADATAEQTTGIVHVGSAIAQLDRVTQQNAALVEQSAAAADSLRGQAAQLAGLVATFKTMALPLGAMDRDGIGEGWPRRGHRHHQRLVETAI